MGLGISLTLCPKTLNCGGARVIYLVDPSDATLNWCITKCKDYCGIKPCYGIDPIEF